MRSIDSLTHKPDDSQSHRGNAATRTPALWQPAWASGGGVLLAIALAWPAAAAAQIYAGAGSADGAVVLSNFRSEQSPELLLAAPIAAPPAAPAVALSPPAAPAAQQPLAYAKPSRELLRLIDWVAAEVNLPADLLRAVIAVESNYELKARSPRGAMGLMQLLPATAKRFGAINPYAAGDNVMAGASYLKWLLALFDNDLTLALAAYNAGEQAVIKAGHKIPPFPETQAYVPRVLALRQSTALSQR